MFGNILAGVILIAVITYLANRFVPFHIAELFVLPFWAFEIFVAFVQAFVFFILMNVYFKDAKSEHSH